MRCQAQLVAKGFNQVKGIAFQEAFAPFPRYTTFLLILSVSVTMRHVQRVLNVKNAFLSVSLKEKIYMGQPDGIVRLGKEDCSYALRKTLHELR